MDNLRNSAPAPLQTLFDSTLQAARADAVVDWPTRQSRLERLAQLVRDYRGEFARAISADFGNRARQETEMLEVFPSLEGIAHALRHGRRWMRSRRRRTGRWFLPGASRLVPQPLGVVGIVTPWNYPLYLTAGPLASAFVAGNRTLVKLSEFAPSFGAAFERAARAHFALDELAVINGDAGVAQAFCALPFDHLLYTGSTAVGHLVMRAASQNLTPVTLELGGKSPAIIGPDADFAHAVERIMTGKLLNAGQTCIAPDYVLLPAGSEDRFAELARAHVQTAYPQLNDDRAAAPDYTTIIAPRHFDRLTGLIAEAQDQGATVVPLTSRAADRDRRLMPPLLVVNAGHSARLMNEEIFGPILPLVPYHDLDAALAFVNARPRPLALYLFARDKKDTARVLERTIAGGVTINDTLLHIAQDDLPFGGVGASGMGAYHGAAGFATFSHLKPVFRQSRINGMRLFAAPYGKTFDRLMRFMGR